MLAIISHDAGGAEVLSSFVRRSKIACMYVLAGPAKEIFERKLGPIKAHLLNDALSQASSFLCGTSWPSDWEFSAIKAAKKRGISSIAFLDHWVNYRERFVRDAELQLPDQIWVGDVIAERIARDIFKDVPIRLVENPYMLDVKDSFEAQRSKQRSYSEQSGLKVLYVTEPTAEHAQRRYNNARHWGYTEQEALRFFLANHEVLGKSISRVVIRPHPSESDGKYNWVAGETRIPVLVRASKDRLLTEEIADCDVVVGCNSMAMVVGVWGRKRVICSIPPSGTGFVLPQPEIEVLHHLVRKS